MTPRETPQRSMVKSLTWRAIATLTTITLVYLFTSNFVIASTIGGLEIMTKLVIYYAHDRVWNHISWGIQEE